MRHVLIDPDVEEQQIERQNNAALAFTAFVAIAFVVWLFYYVF